MTGTGPGLRDSGADGDGQTVQGNILSISFIFIKKEFPNSNLPIEGDLKRV